MDEKENRHLEKSLRLIVTSSSIFFIGLILSKIFSYVYRIIIARSFGPEIFGLFSLAIVIAGWFGALATLGLADGLLRYVSFYRGKKQIKKIRHIFRFSSIILAISSVVLALILFFTAKYISIHIFHNASLIVFLKVFSILIPISIFSSIFLSIMRAYEEIGWNSFINNIFQNGVKVLILILLIFLSFSSNSVIFSYAGGVLLTFLFCYFVSKYKFPEIFKKYKLKPKNKIISNLLSYSWPLMFLSFFSSIFYWIDSLAIGYFKTAEQVGFYNAAVPIAFLLNFIPIIFLQLFYPLIVKEFSKKNLKIIKEMSKQVGKWIFIFNLPLLLFLVLFPGVILNLLFGSQYLVAATAVRILAIGAFFFEIGLISNYLISMKGKSKVILINIIIASILNVILNILLIPKYGINGAAIATTISLITISLMQLLEANYYLKIIPIRRKMLNILLVTIPPLIILLYTKQFIKTNIFTLILQGSLFLLIYFFLILITKCLDKNDLMILRTIKEKLINKKREKSKKNLKTKNYKLNKNEKVR